MLQYQFRPLEQGPGERARFRTSSKFITAHSKTLDLLERELKHLSAKRIVIQADCDASQIRNDGMLYSNARMRSPGIILSFDSKHGPLSYPCDKYNRWEDNLRAIALSLEALRSVDRYGVTRRAEQYKGWARIAGPGANGTMTIEAAAGVIAQYCQGIAVESIVGSPEGFRAAYREAAAFVHPDRTGEDAQFKTVQEAKVVLEKHHAR